MRNRLIMGAIRYGLLKTSGKPQYDRVNSMRQRLDLYEASGNAEHLVDIANICLCEFEESTHPKFHFTAQDNTTHVKKKVTINKRNLNDSTSRKLD